LPLIAAQKAARSATSVFPKPTSPAVDRGAEGCAQRDFRFSEADVAADEPVHRPPGHEIVEHGVDRLKLILGFVEGETGAKFVVNAFRRREFGRLTQHSLCGDLDETLRHFADAVLHPRLAALPGDAAQPVELRFGVFRAIAREEFDIFDRQVELVSACVMDLQTIVRRAGCRNRLEPYEAPDAVIDMDDEIARRQSRDLAKQILCMFGATAAAHETVAENVLLSENDIVLRLESVLHAQRGEACCAFAESQRLGERGDVPEVFQPVFREDVSEALA
jgi:hypothetical protein